VGEPIADKRRQPDWKRDVEQRRLGVGFWGVSESDDCRCRVLVICFALSVSAVIQIHRKYPGMCVKTEEHDSTLMGQSTRSWKGSQISAATSDRTLDGANSSITIHNSLADRRIGILQRLSAGMVALIDQSVAVLILYEGKLVL
jgi:hypothetical protein